MAVGVPGTWYWISSFEVYVALVEVKRLAHSVISSRATYVLAYASVTLLMVVRLLV